LRIPTRPLEPPEAGGFEQMAKKAAKKKRSSRGPKPDFHRQTVLFQWALSQFGVSSLQEFRDRFQIGPEHAGGLDERTGLHVFFEAIAGVLPTVTDGNVVPVDKLQEYERNLLEHTQAINTARLHHNQPKIDWLYHQYLSLLFTEMFLDRYFDDAETLREEINEQIEQHNDVADTVDRVEKFAGDDPAREELALLAFWSATGSGKTLLMHVHIRQFRHYHKVAFENGQWPKLDQIILVTPNEGLTKQHAEELDWSGFKPLTEDDAVKAPLYSAGGEKIAVKVLEIHKFRDDQGKTTYATEQFEGCNLVLVDEGHRGAGRGEEGAWFKRRDQLAKGGFCFEYSATFKEAVQDVEWMRNRYARSILVDYAYRNFYRDGYGKDFTILNLEDDDKRKPYLTAGLLLFYQQMRVWLDGGETIKPFLIDKPLWVFVGHTVAGKVSTKDDKVSVSDVTAVLLFFKEFLADAQESRKLIQTLLEEGFQDHQGRNLLAHRLPHLDTSGNKGELAREIHAGILRDIFHAPAEASSLTLAVQMIRSAVGELAVKVGEAEPFGVVNVGEPTAVADACEANGIVRLEDDQNRSSLFRGINRDDSPINLLVGSRKFTEGWNSWRVSSIGLMHMGKSEGTQIIQLFGRGVRLRGYNMSLRRSMVLAKKPPTPKNLRQVETLQVFGVQASYMKTFRDWIYSEVPEAQERQIWELPVIKTLPKRKLKTIRLKEEIDGVKVERGQAFRQLGPLVRLRPPHETSPADAWLRNHKTRLNWLPRVQGIAGQNREITAAIAEADDLPTQKLTNAHVALLDIDDLLFGLEAYKASRGLDRLHVDRASVKAMLSNCDWYELLAKQSDMTLDRYENRSQWQRMAQQLLNSYAERFYRFVRGRWEAPYIEVAEVDERDDSMLGDDGSYTIETTDRAQTVEEIEQIAVFVQDLREALQRNAFAKWSQWTGKWRTVPFHGHLYQPLLYVGKNQMIRVRPVALDKHEADFVDHLAKWCRESDDGIDVFLLRNQSVTGLGFFQAANFYPDFLLWVCDEKSEHLAFVDPKGLTYFDPNDPKIQFATYDVLRLQEIIDRQGSDIRLSAFIISTTPFGSLNWSQNARDRMSKDEVEALGVLFQKDDETTYIETMMRRVTTFDHSYAADER